MALADLDRDGWIDVIALTDWGVELMANQHDGRFRSFGSVSEFSYTTASVAAADLDGDGDVDLLLTDRGRRDLRLYLGVGNFIFTSGPALAIPGQPHTLEVGSLDSDTAPDIVVGCQDTTVVFHGGPGLTFTASTIPEGNGFIAGCLDADSHPDLITDQSVRVSSNNFSTPLPQPIDSPVATYDLDGDGTLDLLGMPQPTPGQSPRMLVSRGLGGAAFAAPTSWRSAAGRRQVPAIADLDHDGAPDVAYAPDTPGTAYVLRGLLGGGFEHGQRFATPVSVSLMATGRLNLDTAPDFVIWDVSTGTVRTMLSNGSGGYSFTAPVLSAPGEVAGLQCADFNGDGIDDVFCRYATNLPTTLSLWFTDGTGALGPRIDRSVNPDVTQITEAVAGDFSGDQRADVFVTALISAGFKVSYSLRGLGNGTFAVSGRLRSLNRIHMVDMNLDGITDAVGIGDDLRPIREYLPTSPGNFSLFSLLELANVFELVSVGDLDLDGAPDLLTLNGSLQPSLYRNLGDGTLEVPVVGNNTLGTSYDLPLQDLDADDRLDAYRPGVGIDFWRGQGGLAFAPLERLFASGAINNGFVLADADLDGHLDAWRSVVDGVLLMKNNAGRELLDTPPTQTPRVTLGLRVQPNPSSGPLAIMVSVERAGPVQVDVVGVDGRCWERSTQTAAAGRWTYKMRAALPAGLYFVRVRQGLETRVGRAVILR